HFCFWGGVSYSRRHVRVTVLDLHSSRLSGSISPHIGNLTFLKKLDLNNNTFHGAIPPEIGRLRRLRTLFLYNNSLGGEIPSNISGCSALAEVHVRNNKLVGSLPRQLGFLYGLQFFHAGGNRLTGSILPSFGNLTSIRILALGDNQMGLTSLSMNLNLSHNHFVGSIPIEVENLKNLGSLDLSYNMISNNIPSSLGKCVSLEFVQLQANLLRGTIPSSLDSLRGIRLFDVSSNNLSGQIPKFFEKMNSLQLLNLSYNKFEGEVPAAGVLNNSRIISVIGNGNLCGGFAELNLPHCSFRQPKKKLSYKWKVFISTICSIVLLFFLGTCLHVFWMKRKGKLHVVSSDDDFDTRVSYQSLHKATNGFSTTNLIGVGSFGSVYNGVVNINGKETTIAAKVFNLQRRGASKSFMAECEALKNIRHINLVRILTVCSGVDYQGNDFKALVYEFVVNGSLENWLHPVESFDDPPKTLKFRQRVTIAINVASALDYIHNLYETPIVHCDIKPDNVLLDDHMVAHVGDFGLARFLESSSEKSSSIGIKGTVGYAPPVSVEGDMYSYGILLLEMFTRRRPIDESLKDGLNLHNFVNAALLGQGSTIAEVVDPTLLNELLLGRISEKALICMLEIGVACSFDSPQERLSISEVLSRLNKPLV
ncbi:unnamed protein product, partial [Linum tenue]